MQDVDAEMRGVDALHLGVVRRPAWMFSYYMCKRNAACHLGIVLPPYETTHEVSVAGRRSEDIAI